MKFKHLLKALAPVAALALAGSLSACHGHVSINGEDGKKLSELDLSGTAPEELVLAGPDEVRVTQGDKLAITVTGEGADQVRFTLKGGALGIMRENCFKWHDGDKAAVVNVTMPAPKELTLAGSGKISTPALAKDAKVTVAGSGSVEAAAVAGDTLELTIAGSGEFRAAGSVQTFDLKVMGSGSSHTDGLMAGTAKVTIAGSGDAAFASDGQVDAKIMGSGEVRVRGRATCKVSSMGSGKLVCEPGDGGSAAATPPTSPAAPAAPAAPAT